MAEFNREEYYAANNVEVRNLTSTHLFCFSKIIYLFNHMFMKYFSHFFNLNFSPYIFTLNIHPLYIMQLKRNDETTINTF